VLTDFFSQQWDVLKVDGSIVSKVQNVGTGNYLAVHNTVVEGDKEASSEWFIQQQAASKTAYL